MIRLGTTYICVKNMEKSINFYKLLLQQDPIYMNEERWVTFKCGQTVSLYNKEYDQKIIENHKCFNQAYIDDFFIEDDEKKNNIMILNFEVDNLKAEYERLLSLNIGEVSKLMYVNVHMPYWYFNIKDPDGNILEITGDFEENK
ncbi:VOC family protein [Longibaculum muris]|uniref:VOC family protein n=1 Tax=Longibaculum muris TaxID=1796628 RepID=UPI0022DEF2F8|nr:VOC family protein [Longibaculum muris]